MPTWVTTQVGKLSYVHSREVTYATEVADRAVPGHGEGDLIFGKKTTTVGTLVERDSR